ncbi:hypothetical protein H6801_00200 [Candidatus Nomurabacteria bacterium]|nr:hypothetical protein [Candidatus Nomurabacteria bacterium]
MGIKGMLRESATDLIGRDKKESFTYSSIYAAMGVAVNFDPNLTPVQGRTIGAFFFVTSMTLACRGRRMNRLIIATDDIEELAVVDTECQ